MRVNKRELESRRERERSLERRKTLEQRDQQVVFGEREKGSKWDGKGFIFCTQGNHKHVVSSLRLLNSSILWKQMQIPVEFGEFITRFNLKYVILHDFGCFLQKILSTHDFFLSIAFKVLMGLENISFAPHAEHRTRHSLQRVLKVMEEHIF